MALSVIASNEGLTGVMNLGKLFSCRSRYSKQCNLLPARHWCMAEQ